MSVAAVASRPEVGSSMKSRLGLATSSRPILTRLRCPPLMPRFSTDPISECCPHPQTQVSHGWGTAIQLKMKVSATDR